MINFERVLKTMAVVAISMGVSMSFATEDMQATANTSMETLAAAETKAPESADKVEVNKEVKSEEKVEDKNGVKATKKKVKTKTTKSKAKGKKCGKKCRDKKMTDKQADATGTTAPATEATDMSRADTEQDSASVVN